jgi:ketosteroid isomerase-like protein
MNNSNKEILLLANDAMATGRIDEFLQLCTPDITMSWPGSPVTWHGPEEIRRNMGPMMADGPAFSVHVLDYIVEGDRAMGHGTMKMSQPDGTDQTLYFSDVYYFQEGKITRIISYMLGLTAEQMQAPCTESSTAATTMA